LDCVGGDDSNRGVMAGAMLLVGFAASSLGSCSDGSDRPSPSGGSATGGAAGIGAGADGGECSDEFFVAASKLLDLEIRYRGSGSSASERECALVPAETSCFRSCGRSVLAGAEDDYLAELAALDDEICPAIVECGLEPWRSPVRCPELVPTCYGACREICAGECAFDALRPAQGGCECESSDGELPYWAPEPCCLPNGGCGAGNPEFFGSVCFPVDASAQIQSDQCPSERVVVAENTDGGAPIEWSLTGCCLPTGDCGLDMNFNYAINPALVPGFGIGCIERSALSAAAARACTTERELWPAFERIGCTPSP
jgi:hypothetical protein